MLVHSLRYRGATRAAPAAAFLSLRSQATTAMVRSFSSSKAMCFESSAARSFSRSSARPFANSSIVSLRATAAVSKKPTSATEIGDDGVERRILTFRERSGNSVFKTFLPVTPSLRARRVPISDHLHKGGPVKDLTLAKRSTGGRNNHGRITVRARGGGHRRRLRLVDFWRNEPGAQVVKRIEYDPGRSAHIALIEHSVTHGLSYIIAPASLREGDVVQSYRAGIPDSFRTEDADTVGTEAKSVDYGAFRLAALRPGNCLPLKLIPVGTTIYNVSLSPTGKAVLARSAGVAARIVGLSTAAMPNHYQIKLASGELRWIHKDCFASIGVTSNGDHHLENYAKAGRLRWLGFRPQSRGTAMNACDHPHGGGRGKSKGGNVPRDPWGNLAKGGRSRRPSDKRGNKMVIKERPRGAEKRR